MMLEEYIDKAVWERIQNFSENKETPFLVIDLETIKRNYMELKYCFGEADIYYAVKANPNDEVLRLLKDLGSCFDAASIYEIDKLLNLGVSPDRISFGNTIKKVSSIEYAYEKGIRLFTTDSRNDLINISRYAPSSKVFIRLIVEGSLTADWPLARKFGCSIDEVKNIITLSESLDVEVYGLSFHVGSQQRNVFMWEYALLKVKDVFEWAQNENGIALKAINMGGGLPSKYLNKAEEIGMYSEKIQESLSNHFNDSLPRIILEPGRSLVGDSGVIVSEVVLVSKKSDFEQFRWVYLDVGKFNGLIETMDECIKYPIYSSAEGESQEVILAGPTCDSVDIMYEKYMYSLPLSLKEGDRIYWLSTGAYTSSYCSVEFNGFPPMKTYCI